MVVMVVVVVIRIVVALQGINISHLGKRKIIFKMPFLGDMLVPWRVVLALVLALVVVVKNRRLCTS